MIFFIRFLHVFVMPLKECTILYNLTEIRKTHTYIYKQFYVHFLQEGELVYTDWKLEEDEFGRKFSE